MKKEYAKPYIMVESFQLNAAIAASCSSQGATPIHYGVDTCTAQEEAPGLGYFGVQCDWDVNKVEFDENDTICYHGPKSDLSVMFLAS